MLAEQRYQKILDLMQADGSVRVAELKKTMEVSSETIRRDLENMESMGLIRRTRGGAFLNTPLNASLNMPQDTPRNKISNQGSSSPYVPFGARGREHQEGKAEVARFAAEFIKDGQSIALDSGSTACQLAREIKNKFQSLTVVTNSCAVINELSDSTGITLIATGGVYRPEEMAFVSDIAGLIFSRLSIDTFFLTTCGVSVDKGVTYQRMDEIFVQEKMMAASDRTFVIADSSKLGVNSLVKMCDIDRISMIITDSAASDRQVEPFTRAGVRVERAGQNTTA